MVQRIGGFRRKTRNKLKKSIRQKGKVSLTKYFQSFKDGERVLLKAEPAVQKGMYFPRYHGLSGVVKEKRGNCYAITIKDHRTKEKTLIVHPVHLSRMN